MKRKHDEIVTVEEDPIRNVKLKKPGSKEQKKEKGISYFSIGLIKKLINYKTIA